MREPLCALAVVVIGLPVPGPAAAHFQSGMYSHSGSGCSSRTDPITVVFYGDATAVRVQDHVRYHAGWGGRTGGGQYFASHEVCGETTYHAYSGCAVCTRYHIRLRQTYHRDATWGTTATGTPHHEDWVSTCNYGWGGHAVDKGGVDKGEGLHSGFDQGRTRIYDALYGKAGHAFAGAMNWGNTQEFKQCDGDWAGSHSSVFWFRIPKGNH